MSTADKKSLATQIALAALFPFASGHLVRSVGDLAQLNLAAYSALLAGQGARADSEQAIGVSCLSLWEPASVVGALVSQYSVHTSFWLDVAMQAMTTFSPPVLADHAGMSATRE
ncbi:hypothetical protein [Paraburkholderia bannensis]|uniref:hypothetical protein n=1 Tax=Paraburkholderia bannensis TaxID=765414 RepID=UPI002AB60E8E|nr:hypothetical protein [Paraburkholderia bannensis]